MNDVLNARRARAAAAWDLRDEVVLVAAGEPISIPGGADQTYPFLAHSEYIWLADRETPGAVVAFDPKEGWTDFVPDVTERERVWEGKEQAAGRSIGELAGWLGARRGRVMVVLGCDLPGVRSEPARALELRELLTHARRAKDAAEIERLKRAAAATAPGYARLRGLIKAGVTERSLQVELEAEFFRHGGDRTSYESIVASGPRSAVLHAPATQRRLGKGELILVDAGAEVERYACDVTRTYAVDGAFTPFQRDLYQVVLRAEENGIRNCVVGRPFRDVHLQAARDMMEGLVGMGLMRGRPDALVESEAHTLFFPHGLGHMVGLGVRDASGRLPGAKDPMPPMLSTLRTDVPLEPGYVMTIEPGIYFIPPLLQDPGRRARYKDAVNWEMADRLLDAGGIRIEDNVLVTKDGPEVLTRAIPK
ncbi:MAG: aminopeptidase P family protein [Candidatus Eisenbacteria bacterium]|nr:aminopeptidase P family protein [Candidatus Eisenbacteria bacterium]